MSIVSSAIVKSYTRMSDSDYTSYGSYIHDAIEQYIKDQCNLDFVATTYSNELYNGNGSDVLYLKHRPVNYVSRLAVNREYAIKIQNSKTDATSVIVRIDATNCTLIVDGGAGNSSNALALATNTTLTLLVAAINALSAQGWSAELYDSDYGSIKTTILIPQTKNCTTWGNGAQTWNYLEIAGEPVDFELYSTEGKLVRSSFGNGNNNIIVTYNAEESPADIIYAIITMVSLINDARIKNNLDVTSWRVGEIEMTYATIRSLMPQPIVDIIAHYRETVI